MKIGELGVKIRCFVCEDIPDEIKSNVKVTQEEMKKCEADVKFVNPENLHFTLKFLGYVEENQIKRIVSLLESIARITKPFEVSLRGLGYHGSRKNPRNVWIRAEKGLEEMRNLMKRIESIFESEGFPKDGYEANPHLTILRMRSNRGSEGILGKVEASKDVDYGKFLFSAVILKKSTLTPKGPIYTDLHRIRLGQSET